MRKSFRFYMVIWAIMLALFNVVCFVIPREIAGYDRFGWAFWISYGFITLAFVGQLACAFTAFKAENLQKFFYKMPLISVSYTGLVLTVIVGAICMAIPALPNWIAIIVCAVVLAFNVIAVVKAEAAADIVSSVDDKVKRQTEFVKIEILNIQNIMNRAKSDDVKAECKKAYEAMRYSDPMSSPALSTEEAEISAKTNELKAAVSAGEDVKAISAAEELVLLIKERNAKCKALK